VAVASARKLQSDLQRGVERLQLGVSQWANVIGKERLREAYELVAVNTAFVLEAFVDADGDLCGETIMNRLDRCAHDGLETRVDEHLTAYHDKSTLPFRIARRGMLDEVEVSAPHRAT
jgi:hypothetical protein